MVAAGPSVGGLVSQRSNAFMEIASGKYSTMPHDEARFKNEYTGGRPLDCWPQKISLDFIVRRCPFAAAALDIQWIIKRSWIDLGFRRKAFDGTPLYRRSWSPGKHRPDLSRFAEAA